MPGEAGPRFVQVWEDQPNGSIIFTDRTSINGQERYYLGAHYYPGPLEIEKPESLTLQPEGVKLYAVVRIFPSGEGSSGSWCVKITAGAALYLSMQWGIPVQLSDEVLSSKGGHLPRVVFPPLSCYPTVGGSEG